MATTALTTAAEGAGRPIGKAAWRPAAAIGASQGEKSWVAKDTNAGRGDWQAWRGSRSRAWSDPAKKEELGPLDVYSRDLLLQFHASSTPSTSAPSSESPGSSPRSLGSLGGLYCAPLEQLAEKHRERCNSEDQHAGRSRCGSEESIAEKLPASEDATGEYTTVILRGVPKGLQRTALCEKLSEHGFGHDINFLYLPSAAGAAEVGTDNAGYVSINLRTKEAREVFRKAFHGVKASICFPDSEAGDDVCQVQPSEVQGLERNMESLCTPQNIYDWSRQGDAWQPLFLDEDGARVPMPMPGGRPRAASDPIAGAPGLSAPGLGAPGLSAPKGPAAGSDQFMAYMSYMHMSHMQAQMQMQFMQQQMLKQQRAAQQAKKQEKDKKNKQMSASSPEFKPSSPEFKPSSPEFKLSSPEFKPSSSPEFELSSTEFELTESKPAGEGLRAEAPAFVPSA